MGIPKLTLLHRTCRWLITPPREPVTCDRILGWWELRRIPYNLIIGGFGVCALAVFLVSISTSGHLRPGEDAVEPIALLFAPIAANICYTAGWIVDGLLRLAARSLSPKFTPLLFCFGLVFSLFVISVPAVFWGCVRLVQLLHIVG